MIPPAEADWHKAAPADGDALANDRYGCCVPVESLQEIRLRRANAAGDSWKPTAAMALARYARLTGFNIVTGQPDDGTDTAAETSDYCTNGIQIDPQTVDIPHWAILSPGNRTDMKIAVAHLCAVTLTINLPLAAQDLDFSQTPGSGADWVAGSWGMHRVLTGRYDGDIFWIRTWGLDYPVHPEFMDRYVVAAEVRVSRTWLEATGLAPSGLDWDALMADRARLAERSG